MAIDKFRDLELNTKSCLNKNSKHYIEMYLFMKLPLAKRLWQLPVIYAECKVAEEFPIFIKFRLLPEK